MDKIYYTKNFIKKASLKFKNKFDYSLVEYVNNQTSIIIICPIHGKFKRLPNDFLKSRDGCQKCAKKKCKR